MGRVLRTLAIVLGVWVGAEVMTKGVDHALGGLFARFGLSEKLAPSDGDRIDADTMPVPGAKRYRAGFDRGIERVDKALEKQ